LQLLDPVHGDPIGFGHPRQAVEPLLVAERGVDGGLKLIADLLSAFAEILLRRADFIEDGRHQTVPHLARLPEVPDLIRQ